MFEFTWRQDAPFLNLLVLHDDPQREFDYTTGADQAIERARTDHWTIISIKDDWRAAFAPRL
jgi:hypothetical protein